MTGYDHKDWIDLYLDYTAGLPSPELFRLWSGITCVAGLLERRVWIKAVGRVLYPNLYVLLVSTPGGGKSLAIDVTDGIWRSIKDLRVSPHDMTKAALVDNIMEAKRVIIHSPIDMTEFHSLQVAADEFGVLVPAHDLDFLSTLNRLYDCPPQHTQDRRGFKEKVDIINPQLNILAGTQPAYLANLLPETAWGMGFMSRMIMIYSGERVRSKDIFNGQVLEPGIGRELRDLAHDIFHQYGPLGWSREAADLVQKWSDMDLAPAPEHSKLEHYNARRLTFTLKLATVSAASRGADHITIDDFNRAREWLLTAEQPMPDVFREMVHKSDSEVISELHFYVWNKWVKDKKDIPEVSLVHFLINRVPADRIQRIIDTCVKSNIFDRMAGTELYRPRPKHEHGVE